MPDRNFYRSKNDIIIAGVSAGLANYFAIDPLIIRLLFVALALFGGSGIIIYVLLWIFVPEKPNELKNNTMEQENQNLGNHNQNEQADDQSKNQNKGSLIGGVILITLGVIFLLDRFFPRIDFGDLWPIILIVAGALLLRNSFTKSNM